jgi:hypothetical protein
VSRFRKALVPLIVGCASGIASAQLDIPDQAMARRYEALVDAMSRRHGVDGALVHAVIFTESSYEPRAVSPQGAMGLMQLMPATARRYGARNPFDAAQNIEAGVRMLRDLLDLFDHDMELALAAYNAGPGAVIRAGRRIPRNDETLSYVPRVLAFYRAYRMLAAKAANEERFDPFDSFDPLDPEELFRALLATPDISPPREPEAPEQNKRPACLASTRRQRRKHPARIFGTGATTPRAGPEPFTPRRGHKSIDDIQEVPMATAKQSTPRKSAAQHPPQITPMPFPGESPTVSLALAAGRKYGLHEEEKKPAPARAKGKKASGKKTASKAAPRKKTTATRKKAAR